MHGFSIIKAKMPEKLDNINLAGRFAWESIVVHKK